MASVGRGTFFKVNVEVAIDEFLNLVKTEREFRADVLWQMGKLARQELRKRFMSSKGPYSVKMHGRSKGKKGYKISTRMNQRLNKVTFHSSILSPFEFGRKYKGTGVPGGGKPNKDGKYSKYARKARIPEPAREILTKRFRTVLEGKADTYGNKAIIRALKKRNVDVTA